MAHSESHEPHAAEKINWLQAALALLALGLLLLLLLSKLATGETVCDITQWVFLIPLLPGLGAFLNGVFNRRLPKFVVNIIAIGSVWSSFFIGLMLFIQLKMTGEPVHAVMYHWIFSDALHLNIAFTLDQLSGVMVLVVTFVGGLIHLYSVGYMADDESYSRYFTYLNLFTFSMLVLVLGDSIPLMFVGWEGVGLCSYLLIGFWFDDPAKATAGKKAFIVNRIGDMGVMIAMFILFYATGALSFAGIQENVDKISPLLATLACLALFLGATGKSAQLPLYVWLPDAMAGPTPVSALIHAATMVTAGVYMIARLSFLFVLSPTAMLVVATIGGLTALFAATIGLFQYDIKKVLAYSTVSQLGYMFLAVGVGAFSAGVFHLMTHAFFKACLFLGSGSVIMGMHHEQDIRKMGGLAKKMPITRWTFFLSCLAIAGIFPFAGFFSKDEILWKAFTTHNTVIPGAEYVLYGLGMLAAFCTAFYMFRLYFITFSGENRADKHTQEHIKESPWTMTVPLIILAGFATIIGFVGMPHVMGPNLFEHHLEPVLGEATKVIASAAGHGAHPSAALEWGMMGVSLAVAGLGIGLAYMLYGGGKFVFKENANFFYKLLRDKYYVDEGYFYAFVRPLVNFSQFLWKFVDTYLIDGLLVHASSWTVRSVGEGLRLLHTGNVQHYLFAFLLGVVAIFVYLLQGTW